MTRLTDKQRKFIRKMAGTLRPRQIAEQLGIPLRTVYYRMQVAGVRAVDTHGCQCPNCGHKPANRSYGLCWICSMDPDIRAIFKARTSNKHRARNFALVEGHKPTVPLCSVPGEEARQQEYRERLERGESLWNPQDRRERRELTADEEKTERERLDRLDRGRLIRERGSMTEEDEG